MRKILTPTLSHRNVDKDDQSNANDSSKKDSENQKRVKKSVTASKREQQSNDSLKAIVIEEYQPSSDLELTLKVGDVINVLSRDGKMWKGEIRDQVGLFPASIVKLVTEGDDGIEAKTEEDMQMEADISKCIAPQEDDPPEMLGNLPKLPSKTNKANVSNSSKMRSSGEFIQAKGSPKDEGVIDLVSGSTSKGFEGGSDLHDKQVKSGGGGVGNAKDNMEYIGRLMKMEKQLADEKRKTAQLEQQLIDSENRERATLEKLRISQERTQQLISLTRELQQKNEEFNGTTGLSRQEKINVEAVGKRAEELEEKLKSMHDKFLSDGASSTNGVHRITNNNKEMTERIKTYKERYNSLTNSTNFLFFPFKPTMLLPLRRRKIRKLKLLSFRKFSNYSNQQTLSFSSKRSKSAMSSPQDKLYMGEMEPSHRRKGEEDNIDYGPLPADLDSMQHHPSGMGYSSTNSNPSNSDVSEYDGLPIDIEERLKLANASPPQPRQQPPQSQPFGIQKGLAPPVSNARAIPQKMPVPTNSGPNSLQSPPMSSYQPVSKVVGAANLPNQQQPQQQQQFATSPPNQFRPPQGAPPIKPSSSPPNPGRPTGQPTSGQPFPQKAPTPSSSPKSGGNVPASVGGIRLNPLWFYGEMSRSDAETRLKAFPNVNVFLIRYSSSVQSYTISKWLPSKQKFYHCIVRASPSDGKFRLEESLDKDSYPSLEDVVAKSSEVRGFTPLGLLAAK